MVINGHVLQFYWMRVILQECGRISPASVCFPLGCMAFMFFWCFLSVIFPDLASFLQCSGSLVQLQAIMISTYTRCSVCSRLTYFSFGEGIEADCASNATSAIDMSPSGFLYSGMLFHTFVEDTSVLWNLIVRVSSGSSSYESSMSLSNASGHSCSGIAGSSMIGSHFPLSRLASLINSFSGRGYITGFILTAWFLSDAMGTGVLTICFSSGPGKASRALYQMIFGEFWYYKVL